MSDKAFNANEPNMQGSEYVSVSDLDNIDVKDETDEYGIFGFLADLMIFGIEKPGVEPEVQEEKKPSAPREPIELTERDTSDLYDLIYLFGLRVMRTARHIGRRILGIISRPLHAISVFAGLLFVLFDKVLLSSFHRAFEDFHKLRGQAKNAVNGQRSLPEKEKLSLLKRLGHYSKSLLKSRPDFYKTLLNTAVPVAAFALLVVTVGYWTGSTYALEVIVDNGGEECSLGYISDESVFMEARTIVKERIDSGVSEDSDQQSLIAKPTYKITRVKLNQLSDADAISDKLIENSDSKLTNACGVYIDGEFLCAVKNETDARSVFNNILKEAEKKNKISEADENSFADFVEDVDFVQGLYSDNPEKMWEASRLLDTLENEKKSAAVYYTVTDGDTPSEVAQRYDLSTAQLMALNPSANFKSFNVGTRLVISQEVSFVRVKIIKVEEKRVETPYKTEKTESSKLFKGDKRVIRKGVKGTDKVTYLVTYVDGVQTSAKEIERVTLIEPTSEKVQIGTKSTSGRYGSYKVTPTKGRFVWPVSGLYTVSSKYGYRKSGFHTGVDITGGGASGHIVVAADGGTVELVKRSNKSYGNQIVINHGGGVKTRYAHLLDGSISVSVGQKVSRGQAIGRVGSTGNSSGPHLHFEVIVNGNTVNPMNYIGR